MKTEDIVKELKRKYTEKIFTTVNNEKTVEIINACFEADSSYLLRRPNADYIAREINWYESQSLNVNDIQDGAPAIWQKVSSDNGYINSNYGYLLHSDENHNQYDNVVHALLNDKHSRQAIAIYTRPTMHTDSTQYGMHDFCCTNTVQYLYRDGELNAIVSMRSNDAVFGYNNDIAWQQHVLTKLCSDLHLTPGKIYWNAGSLHVYERHFNLLGEDNDSDSQHTLPNIQ